MAHTKGVLYKILHKNDLVFYVIAPDIKTALQKLENETLVDHTLLLDITTIATDVVEGNRVIKRIIS